MKKNHSSGEVSRILLILAAAILVLLVVVFVVIKISNSKKAANNQAQNQANGDGKTQVVEPPKLVRDATLGEIKFILQGVTDRGSVLTSTETYDTSIKTTERFIQVTVGAQNQGKNNIEQYGWDLGNIVDSEGRNFLVDQRAYLFIPKPDLCGAILKPAFKPTSCVKIYEVSRQSKGLKLQIINQVQKQSTFLDLD